MIDDKGWGDGIDRPKRKQPEWVEQADRDFLSRTQDGFLWDD